MALNPWNDHGENGTTDLNGSHFREEYELTIGVELGMIRNPEFPEFVLNVWDLAGQESFR